MYPDRIAQLALRAEFTGAQLEVARLVACNMTNTAIARHLCRSEDTVKTHLRRMLRKTGTTSRCQLVVWMYEAGHLVPAHPEFLAQPHPPEPPAPTSPAARNLHHTLSAARSDLDSALTHLGTL
nr:helix-turn-helix transcriptional regulator [Saccharopolyspora gloriosae]